MDYFKVTFPVGDYPHVSSALHLCLYIIRYLSCVCDCKSFNVLLKAFDEFVWQFDTQVQNQVDSKSQGV